MNTVINTQSPFSAFVLATGLFALGCAAMSGGAQAANTEQSAHTRIVRYGELNLDSEQGAKVLYARIRGAAREVCSPLDGRDLVHKTLWQDCFNRAVEGAVAQINRARVTALHNRMVNRSAKG